MSQPFDTARQFSVMSLPNAIPDNPVPIYMAKPGYVGMRPEAPETTPTGLPRNTATDYHRGRPCSYKHEYCQQLLEAAEEGLSLTSFAGKIKVSLETLSRWSANFPEFREAVKTSKAIRTLALERQLLTSTKQPKITAMIFALKNAAPHEFRDKVEIENTNSGSTNPLTQVFASLVQSAGGAVGNVTAFAGVRFEAPRVDEASLEQTVEQTQSITVEAQSTRVEPSAD